VSRAPAPAAALLLLATASGCGHPRSTYAPRYPAEHELVLSYDGGYELLAEGRVVAKGYDFDGLSDFVSCVPRARIHAESAEARGASVVPLSVAGVALAVGGIGGLSGLGFWESDRKAAGALLLGGLAMQVVGLVLVGLGAQAKVSANGHAVDAMNEYNDAVGSKGERCPPPR
jgi:hypothetical protein